MMRHFVSILKNLFILIKKIKKNKKKKINKKKIKKYNLNKKKGIIYSNLLLFRKF